jgi:hypothetical protein
MTDAPSQRPKTPVPGTPASKPPRSPSGFGRLLSGPDDSPPPAPRAPAETEFGGSSSDPERRFDSAGISLRPIPLTEPTANNKRKWFGSVALVAIGLVTGLAINSYKDCKAPAAKTMNNGFNAQKAATPKKDGRCERKLGEGDLNPESKGIYDPACGGCGNGVQDPGETAESCPSDFMCGNGKVDWKAPVVRMVTLPNGTISQQAGTYTESCNPKDVNYCEPDCKRIVQRRKEADSEGDIELYKGDGDNCPKLLISPHDSDGARAYMTNLRAKIWETSETIYSKLVPGDTPYLPDIVLSFKLRIGTDGSIRVKSITPSCDREACDGNAELEKILNGTATSGTLDIPRGSRECDWNLQMRIPKPDHKDQK